MSVSRSAWFLPFCLASLAVAQQSLAPAAQPQRHEPPNHNQPALSHRAAPNPGAPVGQIRLDVLVTDAAGQPVAGLEQRDFTLLDNNKPQEIRSFQAVDGSADK